MKSRPQFTLKTLLWLMAKGILFVVSTGVFAIILSEQPAIRNSTLRIVALMVVEVGGGIGIIIGLVMMIREVKRLVMYWTRRQR